MAAIKLVSKTFLLCRQAEKAMHRARESRMRILFRKLGGDVSFGWKNLIGNTREKFSSKYNRRSFFFFLTQYNPTCWEFFFFTKGFIQTITIIQLRTEKKEKGKSLFITSFVVNHTVHSDYTKSSPVAEASAHPNNNDFSWIITCS